MFIPFWLKKILGALLLPLPVSLFFIALGMILLIIKQKKQVGMIVGFLGLLLVFVFSLNGTANALIDHLESQYSPLLVPPKTVTKIVVLGGGVRGEKNYPANLNLNSASLSRLIESIRLFDQLEGVGVKPILILSGGRVFASPAVAGKMQNAAVMLGISREQIILEKGSRDTREEALYLKNIVGSQPFILVTSAFHMPRAMALFQALGMHPIAAPTQFLNGDSNFLSWCFPNGWSLAVSDTAIHEYFGILWEKINGRIS